MFRVFSESSRVSVRRPKGRLFQGQITVFEFQLFLSSIPADPLARALYAEVDVVVIADVAEGHGVSRELRGLSVSFKRFQRIIIQDRSLLTRLI